MKNIANHVNGWIVSTIVLLRLGRDRWRKRKYQSRDPSALCYHIIWFNSKNGFDLTRKSRQNKL